MCGEQALPVAFQGSSCRCCSVSTTYSCEAAGVITSNQKIERKGSVCNIYVGRVVVGEGFTDVSSTARRRYADLRKFT
jgi:hypothetical protein